MNSKANNYFILRDHGITELKKRLRNRHSFSKVNVIGIGE